MSGSVVQRMRERVSHLRRMAEMVHDRGLRESMLKMAYEVESDANALEAGATRRKD